VTKLATAKTKKIKLALQGGAAFGAFQWGVIDSLLRDGRIEITAVSGASIGAMNSVALAQGLDQGSNATARKSLNKLWNALSANSVDKDMGVQLKMIFAMAVSGLKGTIKSSLNQVVDFDALKQNKNGVPLFISALDVKTQKARIFTRKDISVEAVQASGAVPLLIGSVKVDGREYLDGALIENPVIESMADIDGDLLVIQTFPSLDAPHNTSHEATNTMMNVGMFKDITQIQKDNERFDKNPKAARALGIKKTHTHMINIGEPVKVHNAMNFTTQHLNALFIKGREVADKWLAQNFDSLGVESTFVADHKPAKPAKAPRPARKL